MSPERECVIARLKMRSVGWKLVRRICDGIPDMPDRLGSSAEGGKVVDERTSMDTRDYAWTGSTNRFG